MRNVENKAKDLKEVFILRVFLFILISALCTSQLIGQNYTDTSMAAIYAMSLEELLDTKVTIATKSDQKISETPAIVSVITAEDIQNMGLCELEEIMSLIPGVEFFKVKEGANTATIRGITNLNQGARVLIMLDGIPYNGIMYGTALFNGANLNVNTIERIEIIRGPSSALYGRNAFSIVVNIVTKTGCKNDGFDVQTSYGSYNTFDIALSYGINKKIYNGIISVRKYLSDATNSTFPDGMGGNSLWDVSHNNYFCDANFKIGNFRISGSYSNIKDGVSAGYFNTNGINYQNVGRYSIEYKSLLTDKLNVYMKFYGRNENRLQDIEFFKPTFTDTLPSPYPPVSINSIYPNGMYAIPEFNSYIYGAEINCWYQLLHNNQVLIGLQADKHGIKDATIRANYNFSTSLPLPIIENDSLIGYYNRENMPTFKGNDGWIKEGGHDYYNFALLLQDVYYPIRNLGITMGARYDFDSEIEPVLNPRLGIVYEFYQGAHLKALYGQAYRVPTCSEQYKITGVDIGNEDLEHEKIRSTEIALSYKFRNTITQMSVFHNKASNLIVRNPSNKIYYNMGKNIARGLEFENRIFYSKSLMTFVNYSYIISENTETINDSIIRTYNAPNVSKHMLNAGFNYKVLQHFNLNTYLRYQGPMLKFTDANGNPVSQQDIGNVFLVNTTLGIDIKQWLHLSFSIYNLLNQVYYYQSDLYPLQPKQNGRHYLVRLNLHF